jgi:hypothetical protein
MFDGPGGPKSLDEEVFIEWLKKGRESKIGYNYLLIIWDEYDAAYRPIFVENRKDIAEYTKDRTSTSREWLVAAYDLYSESRIV